MKNWLKKYLFVQKDLDVLCSSYTTAITNNFSFIND